MVEKKILVMLFAAVYQVTGCAGKKNGQDGAALSAEHPNAANPSPSSSVPQPAFSLLRSSFKLRCDTADDIAFTVSDGVSLKNSFLLSRFAVVGAGVLPFESAALTKKIIESGFSSVKLLENKAQGVQGLVITSPQVNIVVFRGTHSAEGIMTNAQFMIQSAFSDGMPSGVHQGFQQAYRSVSAPLSEVVLTADRKTIPTFFVGHSLGGALAMLAALDIQKRGGNVAGLVTLGQPRVGNAAFAAEAAKVLQGKIKRFVNGNDPFPHMPPTAQHSDAALAALLDPATKNATMALLAGITAFTGMSFGKANFTHVGPPSTLSDAAFSRGEFDADSPWDGRYWKENAAQVRQMAANPGAASQLPIVQEHMVESHLCEMLKKM